MRSGRSRSLYLFIRRVIKQIVVIIEAFHFCQAVQNFIHHPAIKASYKDRGNYWGSSIWISTQQIHY